MEHDAPVGGGIPVETWTPVSAPDPEIFQTSVLTQAQLHHLTELGAKVRLQELAVEEALLRRMFPNLGVTTMPDTSEIGRVLARRTPVRDGLPVAKTGTRWSAEQRKKFAATMAAKRTPTRSWRSRTSSAEASSRYSKKERKAISRRMKAYWRKKKKDAA